MTYIAADRSADGVAKVLYESKDGKVTKTFEILKHLDLWDVRRKPPARANGPPTEAFIIYDQSSSPGTDDYIIDADYPIDLSRRSSKNEDGNLSLKKSSPMHTGLPVRCTCLREDTHRQAQTGELCSNRPEIALPA